MPFDATERVRLGRTVLEVTRLGFGAAAIGGLYEAVAESDARATVERGLGVREPAGRRGPPVRCDMTGAPAARVGPA